MAKRPPTSPPRPEVLALLADSKENPSDDTPRLVLADWLEERDDPRGTFVRLQLARNQAEDVPQPVRDPPGREGELLAVHRQAWLGVLDRRGVRIRYLRGLVEASGASHLLLDRRGIAGEAPESLAWVDYLSLDDFHDGDLARLATASQWGCLTGLRLARHGYAVEADVDPATVGLGRGDWAPLRILPALPTLTELDLDCQDVGCPGARVVASAQGRRLRVLLLARNDLGDAGAAVLASSASLTNLAHLNLSRNRLQADGFAALAGWASLASVEVLSLGENYPAAAGVATLVASPHLGRLRDLRLPTGHEPGGVSGFGSQAIGPAGAAALAAARPLPCLERLDLARNVIGPGGAAALAASNAFPNLAELDLSRNDLGDDGAVALAGSSRLRRLRRLDLLFNGIGDRGAAALADSPYLLRLTQLVLGHRSAFSPAVWARLQGRYSLA